MPVKVVHLIGVCGTAMATLAAMLKQKGFDVRGSDQDVYPPMSDFLAAEGIPAMSGYRPEHITSNIDLVIEHFGLDRKAIRERAERKKAHLRGWHSMTDDRGT